MCGLNGQKMIACPKFAKIQKMFQGKISSTSNGKVVANVIIVIADMNLIVNVVTKRKITEKQFL
jgi:molybdopterin-binding protein